MAVVKINKNLYIGESGHTLQNIDDKIFDVISRMDYGGLKSIEMVPMCYQTLRENPDLNKIARPGFYPLYSYNASMENGSTIFVSWGCCIVIPYAYGNNDSTGQDWYMQIIVYADAWGETPRLNMIGRVCSYYGSWGKWRVMA